jgi:hypothetical protein
MEQLNQNPFLNVAEAADFLRLRKRTLDNMRWMGIGPSFRKHGGLAQWYYQNISECMTNGSLPVSPLYLQEAGSRVLQAGDLFCLDIDAVGRVNNLKPTLPCCSLNDISKKSPERSGRRMRNTWPVAIIALATGLACQVSFRTFPIACPGNPIHSWRSPGWRRIPFGKGKQLCEAQTCTRTGRMN